MVRVGDTFTNAASGERYLFRQTAAETAEALAVGVPILGLLLAQAAWWPGDIASMA